MPSRSLPRWGAALARARSGTGTARLLMLGDSTTFGYGAQGGEGALRTPLSVPSQLAALLTASGVRAQANGWMGLSLPRGDPRVALGAGWTATGTPGSLGGACVMATASGGALRFAPGVPVDTFTLYYVAHPANGTLLMDIDAAVAGQVATNGACAISTVTVKAPLGPHTLGVTASVLASGIYVVGCEAHDSARDRVLLVNAGWQGAGSAQVADARDYFSSANAIGCARPDLTTLNVGINDWYAAVPPERFAGNLRRCVDAARRCGDIALCTPTPTDPTEVPASRQREYVEQVIELCDAEKIPVIDLHARFGTWQAAQARGWMNDAVHPNAAGYATAAAAALEVIL